MDTRNDTARHSLTVQAGGRPWQSQVYLNGEELTNVSALTIEMDVTGPPRAHLTLDNVQFIGTGMVVTATLPVPVPGVED